MVRTVEHEKRVLFITYFYPPVRTAGAVRTANMAKYLAKTGWIVTVVTPAVASWNSEALETSVSPDANTQPGLTTLPTEHLLKFLMPGYTTAGPSSPRYSLGGACRWLARRLDIPADVGWAIAAYRICRNLDPEDLDVILVSGGPFASFALAWMLSRRLQRPYVQDYRDLWTGNPHAPRPVRRWSHWIERRLLRDASQVLAAAPAAAAYLARLAGADKVRVVTNGYDPEEMAAVEPCRFDHFAILYAGRFYPPRRSAAPVMAALARLEKVHPANGGEWLFHYYGPHSAHIAEEAARHGISNRIKLHGNVGRAAVLSAIKGAGVSIVITSVGSETDAATRGIITSKLFDALGLGTPILGITPPTSDANAILGTISNASSYPGTDVEGIAKRIKALLDADEPAAMPTRTHAWPMLAEETGKALNVAIEAHHHGQCLPSCSNAADRTE